MTARRWNVLTNTKDVEVPVARRCIEVDQKAKDKSLNVKIWIVTVEAE